MTNLSSLPGFGSGGGGASGDLPPILTDIPTLVDSDADYIRGSNYTQQSSTTYQAFHQLSNDGTFGGLFDPYNSSNTGGAYPVGFYVNPANGSLNGLQRGSSIYNSGGGATFSTCHQGAVGMMVLNNGHHANPGYGTTYKGWLYGATFANDGSITATGESQGPHEYWPHSNGDLMIAADSATGSAYGRRSGYNQGTGTYYHNLFYYTGGGSAASQQEWSQASNTSTNYTNCAAKNSRSDLQPGGILCYQDQSSNQYIEPCYGTSLTRGTNYNKSRLGWTDNLQGWSLSNGTTLWHYQGKWELQQGQSLTTLTNPPVGGGMVEILNNRSEMLRFCIPCNSETDTWVATTSGYGLFKFKIHINDNYRFEALGIYNTLGWLFDQTISHSGRCLGLVGTNDEYLVYSRVRDGYAERYVYENPFAS